MKLTLKSNQKDIKVILKVNNFVHNENIDLNYKSYILDYTNGYLSKSIEEIKLIEFDNMEVDKTNNIAIYKINPNEIFNPEYITKYYMDNRKAMKCLLYRRYMIVTFKDKTQFILYLLSLSSNEKAQFIKQLDT